MLLRTMFHVTWLVLQLHCDLALLGTTVVYASKVNLLFFRFEQSRQNTVTSLGLRTVPHCASLRQPAYIWSRQCLSRNLTPLCRRNSQSTMNVPTSKHLQPHPEGQTSIVSNQVIRWYVCPPWPHATQKLLAPGTIKWKKQRLYTAWKEKRGVTPDIIIKKPFKPNSRTLFQSTQKRKNTIK